MAAVRIEQRNGRLASDVRLEYVNGREGEVAKASIVVISNAYKGPGKTEATSIRWTAWGLQAENAAKYLGKGSRVNVVGVVKNNSYEKDGETVYGFNFHADEIDYLDDRRSHEQGDEPSETPPAPAPAPAVKPKGKAKAGKAPVTAEAEEDIPF